MNKSEIMQLDDTALFIAFHDCTVRIVKEANSIRGESKKTAKEFDWIVDECVKRFNLDREALIKGDVI